MPACVLTLLEQQSVRGRCERAVQHRVRRVVLGAGIEGGSLELVAASTGDKVEDVHLVARHRRLALLDADTERCLDQIDEISNSFIPNLNPTVCTCAPL